MAIIVEDGTIVANANSYVSVTFADTYFSTHLYYSESWDALTTQEKEAALVSSTRYLDMTFSWNGTKTDDSSSLRWPRTGVEDVDGVSIGDNVIPNNLKYAVCEQAMELFNSDVLAESDSTGITELKVDVIELKFDSTDKKKPTSSRALLYLNNLGVSNMGAKMVKVFRS